MAKSYYSFEKRSSFGEISGTGGLAFTADDKSLISAGTTSVGI